MPRQKRYIAENGWYHVVNRGAARRHIFLNDELKEIFLKILEYVAKKYEFKIVAFCIMGNHYHLLINTVHANLSNGLRSLNAIYAQSFNKYRKKDGPVFRGRYQSTFIENHHYLNNVVRYIHLNPESAGIVQKNDRYYWSSHIDYQENQSRFDWLYKITWNSINDYKKYINSGNSEKILDYYKKNRKNCILN